MSIQIPCPQCGRELKLPDRSLLGRKGKCPKCEHVFVLIEPPVVALELAKPEPPSQQKDFSTDDRPIAPFLADPQPKTSAPTSAHFPGLPPELAALDRVAKPKGTAARLKELQKKNARRRNVGLAVTGLILVAVGAVVMFAPQFAAKNRPTTTEESTAKSGSSGGMDSVVMDANPYSHLGSPTKGEPIELRYIPFGTQVVLYLHPAELWKEKSLGEEIRFCVPPLARLIEVTLSDLFQRKPQDVADLMICLIPGPRGSQPDVAAVARLVDEPKRSQLLEQIGQRVDTYTEPVYITGDRAYLIADPKTLAVCPKSQAQKWCKRSSSVIRRNRLTDCFR